MSGLMVTQASQILRCHPNTLKRWERRGLINSSRDVNNWRRFDIDEVLRLKKQLEERFAEGSMEKQLLRIINHATELFSFLLKSRLDRTYPSDGTFSTDPSYAVDMTQHCVSELQRLRTELEQSPDEADTIRIATRNVLLEALKTEHAFPTERHFFTTVRGLIAECEQLGVLA